MDRATAPAPAVADGGTRSPASCHHELQVLRVFDGWDHTLIVVGIHRDRERQRALTPPVPAYLDRIGKFIFPIPEVPVTQGEVSRVRVPG